MIRMCANRERFAARGDERYERRFRLCIRLPASDGGLPRILLAHGGGGELMHRLIEEIFIPSFATTS